MSTICAIVPTFNRSQMLRECLNSLLGQSRKLDQIIVINDGSTDDTASMLTGYGDRITAINKSNGGKSSCLNLAMQKCICDYVWICDDDDIAAPDGLSHLAAALDADPELGFAFGKFMAFKGADVSHPSSITFWYERRDEKDIKILFLEEMIANQYAMLARKSLYDRVGPFNERQVRSQDYEMALRLSRSAKAKMLPEVIFYFREHEGVRGTAAESFEVTRKARKQLEYDQMIFRKVYGDYALSEFLPSFAGNWNEAAARRAALIERTCVVARRALWEEAIADLAEAARSDRLLTPEERNLAEAIVDKEISWQVLAENPLWIERVRQIARCSKVGRDIIIALCRPLMWLIKSKLRDGDVREATSLALLAVRLLGVEGVMRRAVLSSAS